MSQKDKRGKIMYTEECIKTFLEKQEQLFDESVAETYEEAEAFLEECMAVVADSIEDVRKVSVRYGSRCRWNEQ